VIRYAILYFVLLIIFVVLFVGPVVARRFINGLPSIPYDLLQPTGQNNNDTSSGITGSNLVPGLGGNAAATGGSGGGSSDSGSGSGGDSGGNDDPFTFGLGGGGKFVRW
jgi:1,3-beta-glucan synthase